MDFKTKNLIEDEKARITWDQKKRPRVYKPKAVKVGASNLKNLNL